MKNPLEYLQKQIETLSTPELREVCNKVVTVPAFQQGWCSDTKHHAYRGALLYHTAEVLELALAQAAATSVTVDRDVLICATIFHDVMKIQDYTADGKPTDYKSKIYHVAGSYANWFWMSYYACTPTFQDAVGHCILAHHGRREWKTCVEPQTVESLILHHADNLSAQFGKTRGGPDES